MTTEKVKTIHQVYCPRNLPVSGKPNYYWGFGDLIRGTISLWEMWKGKNRQFTDKNGVVYPLDLKVNFNSHPMGKYLNVKDPIILSESQIQSIKFYVWENSYKDYNNMLDALNDQDDIFIFSNMTPWCNMKQLSEGCHEFIQDNCLDMKPEIAEAIPSDTFLSGDFEIIHVRLGDALLSSADKPLPMDAIESVSRYSTKVQQGTTSTIIFLSDCNKLTEKMCQDFNFISTGSRPVHMGLSIGDDGAKDVCVDLSILRKAKHLHLIRPPPSCPAPFPSGFSYFISLIYQIPITVY